MEFILPSMILAGALVLCAEILSKRAPSAQPVVMVEPTPQFLPGRRYYTNTGKAAIVTAVNHKGIYGYIVNAGFTNQPRTACKWDAHGNSPRSAALNLRVEER